MEDSPTTYPHRRDRDGMYDAICPSCFATVARSKPESELAELEKAHVCHSSFLADRGQLGVTVAAMAAVVTTRSIPKAIADLHT